jgi:hypothetical protein
VGDVTKVTLGGLSLTVRQRWYLPAASAALFGVAGLIFGLALPRTYQSQSLVALPETVTFVRHQEYTKVLTTMVNTAETRALVSFLARDLGTGSAQHHVPAAIAINEVRGSNSLFRMMVTVRDDPRAAAEISHQLIDRLQACPAVRSALDAERLGLEARLRETNDAIKRAERMQRVGRSGSTVADIAQLHDDSSKLQTALAQLHSFKLIEGPTSDPLAAPPIWLRTILYAALGLVAGAMVALVGPAQGKQRPQ